MKGHAARGGAALGGAQVVKVGLQLATVLVLARLLQPSDFGLVAAVSPITSFVLLFQDFGLQQTLVQRRSVTHDVVTYVFWISAAIGGICAAAMILASPLIAAFYGDQRLRALAAAGSVVILSGSLSSSPIGLLNRTLQFRLLGMIYAGSAVLAFAVAIAAAWFGAGYWSLLLSTAVATLTILACSWWFSGLRPGRPRVRAPEHGLLSFGAHLTGFAVANYLARNLDNILIGRYLGSLTLGFYDQAYKLLLFPIYVVNAPLSQVMIPLLSAVQDDKPRLRTAYLRVITQIVMLTVPGIAAAAIAAHELIPLLLGQRWAPVAPIFAWLGLAGLTQIVGNSSGWLFISQGKSRIYLHLGLFNSFAVVLAIVIGLQYGAVGVAAAYAIAEFLRVPVLYGVLHRIGPVRVTDLLRVQVPPLVAAGMTYAVIRMASAAGFIAPGLPRVAATFVLSYALYFAMIPFSAGMRLALRDATHLAGSVLKGAGVHLRVGA